MGLSILGPLLYQNAIIVPGHGAQKKQVIVVFTLVLLQKRKRIRHFLHSRAREILRHPDQVAFVNPEKEIFPRQLV
jgi:hypothetical protein